MIHFENIIKFFVILTGFSSLLGIYIFSRGLNNKVIKYYFLGYLFLFSFHLMDLLFSYLDSTLNHFSSNIYLCFTTVLYVIISKYVIYTIRLTAEIVNFERRAIVNTLCKIITMAYLATYIISLGKGDLAAIADNVFKNLWTCGMVVQFPSFIICLFLLWRNYKRIESSVIKEMIKAFLILIVIYLPFMIFENVITNIINWYPFETNLRLYQINFILWSIISSTILFKSINRSEVKSNNNYSLSQREKEVINCLLKSESVTGISEQLFISPRTVEKHISNIYKKVGVNNRADLLNILNK